MTLIFFFGCLFLEWPDPVPVMFADKWYTDAQMTVSADMKHPSPDNGRCFFYAQVPGDVRTGDCLWFKAKNAYITVTVDGEKRAQIKDGKLAHLYGQTPGTDWVYVPFDSTDAGKTIAIDFFTNYSDTSSYIDSVYIGNTVSTMRFAFYDRIFGTVMCILIFFAGIIVITVYFVMSRLLKDMPKDLLYLGCSILFSAIWSLSELRIMQLFTDKSAGLFIISPA